MVLIAVFQSLGKMNCFCIFCQTQIILSQIAPLGRVRGEWWQRGWEGKYLVSHTMLAFWDKGTDYKEKLVVVQKALLRRLPFEFLLLPFFGNGSNLLRIHIVQVPANTHTHMFDFLLSLTSPPFLSFCNSALGTFKSSFIAACWKQPAHLPRRPCLCLPLEDKACVFS